MNQFVFCGNLTRDPEVVTTQGGASITRFYIAVNRDYKDNDGNRPTDFFECVAFSKPGELIAQYAVKGDKLLIRGDVRNNNYEDKNGVKHYGFNFNVDKVEFLSMKSNNQGEQQPARGANGTYKQTTAKPKAAPPPMEEVPPAEAEDLSF